MALRRIRPGGTEGWLRELELVGADSEAWERIGRKVLVLAFRTDPLRPAAANVLKQCMLSGGADAIVSRGAVNCTADPGPAVVLGTEKQLRRACDSLKGQPFGLERLGERLRSRLEGPARLPDRLSTPEGDLDFSAGPLIMGILNVTPDSFSDGGLHLDPSAAVARGREMAAGGAAIVDVGAESTRPGAEPVPPDVQLERLLPVLDGLRGRGTVISVDTGSARVASRALSEGASMINDVTALRDPEMAPLLAERGVPVVLMHMRGTPADMQVAPEYDDVVVEVRDFLEERAVRAVEAGVAGHMILVDPGIGFGKRLRDNLDLIRDLEEISALGYRVVLGHSRKSFLGRLTGIAEPVEREAATHAVTALCATRADVLRVHDVTGAAQVLSVSLAIQGAGT